MQNQEKIENSYLKRAKKMTDYIFREICEHSTSGKNYYSDQNLRAVITGYLAVHLSTANEDSILEEEAIKRAHLLTPKDLNSIVY